MNGPLLSRTLLVLAGLAVYANGLAGPFVFDDASTIVDNGHVHHLWPLERLLAGLFAPRPETSVTGRPVVGLTFALNWALHGRSVWGYHLVNVALHVACGLLLFEIVRRTLGASSVPALGAGGGANAKLADGLALAVSLLWLVHPLNTETVNYITQRTELTMGLFYLLTLYAAMRASQSRGRRGGWTAASIASCALGMASKESMVTAPVAVVLYDLAYLAGPSGRTRWAALRARWPLYVGLASTWIVLALLMAKLPRSGSVGTHLEIGAWTYLLNQCVVVARYLGLVVWPAGLLLDYGKPRELALADVWLPGLVVLGALVGALVLAIRRPRLGFPAAWVFLVLAPTSTVVPIVTEVGAERRMYLPLMGAVTLVVIGSRLLLVRAARAWARRTPAPAAVSEPP